MTLQSRRPIPFTAVCAIARHVLAHRPQFTDCEWKEAVKVMAARQGWEPPTNDVLARALDAVERAVAKVGCPRAVPVVTPDPPPPHRETAHEPTASEARAALGGLKAQLEQRGLPTGNL